MRLIEKMFSNYCAPKITIETPSVVLEALFAYRDELVMSDSDTEVLEKLLLVNEEISNILMNTPVELTTYSIAKAV